MSEPYYRIAIPSLSRAEKLCATTLALLTQRGVSEDRIDIWVVPEERADYRRTLLANGHPYAHFRDAPRGMREVRNAIQRGYTDGTPLVQMDDDVQDVLRLDDARKLRPVMRLSALFVEGFTAMRAGDATLWGPYPSNNALSMKRGVDYGLGLVAGPLFGHLVHGDVTITVPAKTDYEFTVKHWMRDGVICRLHDVAVKTKYRADGGMAANGDRRVKEAEGVTQLLATYPQLLRAAPERKSGYPEMKFRRPRTAVKW